MSFSPLCFLSPSLLKSCQQAKFEQDRTAQASSYSLLTMWLIRFSLLTFLPHNNNKQVCMYIGLFLLHHMHDIKHLSIFYSVFWVFCFLKIGLHIHSCDKSLRDALQNYYICISMFDFFSCGLGSCITVFVFV